MIEPSAFLSCPQCATQIAPSMLACPQCAYLVHGDQLESLAECARTAAVAGDVTAALSAWREALAFLPAGSRQYQVVAAKITELGNSLPLVGGPTAAQGDGRSPLLRAAGALGAIGLMAWKAKAVLLGLTKGSTLFSMVLSLGVYWTVWGWKFALGLVLSIYVHEMGHVLALRRYGFKATAPMFIPGIGALIRMQQQIVNPREDAEIGLAGPVYGLVAAMVALALWLATGYGAFVAIASVGAWINLFNLLPISTLDGGRGFHALSRSQKLLAAATVAACWYVTGDGLLLLLALVCAWRGVVDKQESEGNLKAAVTYCLLVVCLSAVAALRSQAELEMHEPDAAPPAEPVPAAHATNDP